MSYYEVKFAGYIDVSADNAEDAKDAFNVMIEEDYPSIVIDKIIEVEAVS